MTLREVGADERTIWNDFVLNHPDATPYHLYEWKFAFENAYRHRTLYLGAFEDSRLVTIFPVVILRLVFKSPYAVSLPFCNYAGWLIDSRVDNEIVMSTMLARLKSDGISSVEVKQVGKSTNDVSEEVTLRLTLPDEPELLWKSLDSKVRNQIRKAQKCGLTVQWGLHQLDDLYHVYASNMAGLGTPVHSKIFFEQLHNFLSDWINIVTVRKDGRAIAAMLLLKFRDMISDPWASTLRQFDPLCPNMLLHWEALKHACEKKFKTFDFGRSRIDSGTYRFKTQWGAEPHPLEYKVISLNGRERDVSSSFYRGAMAQSISRIWKLIPYSITLWLGPKVRKYLP